MISICIQNLGAYNEGMLRFKWVELPVSDEELAKAYDEIKVCHDDVMYYNDCGCPYKEVMIADYECDFRIGEWDNIAELNEMAEYLETLTDTELEVFNHLKQNNYSFEDAVKKIKNYEYHYIEAKGDYDLGETYINEVYGGIEHMSKEALAEYFDFEAFGRDLGYNEYYETENGYVRID